jgi:hypothetical protein
MDLELRAQPMRCSSSDEAASVLVGLSVRQGAPTGIAVLEKTKVRIEGERGRIPYYRCRYLRRFLSDTSYPALLDDLHSILGVFNHPNLVVEAGTGIRSVAAMFRKARLPARIQPVEVKVTAEDGHVGDLWRVGKGTLIETSRQVLQERRVTFDERMPPEVLRTTPPVRTVYHALLTYPFESSPAANDAFASRDGEYDDLVLAMALACWYGERCQREFWIRF